MGKYLKLLLALFIVLILVVIGLYAYGYKQKGKMDLVSFCLDSIENMSGSIDLKKFSFVTESGFRDNLGKGLGIDYRKLNVLYEDAGYQLAYPAVHIKFSTNNSFGEEIHSSSCFFDALRNDEVIRSARPVFISVDKSYIVNRIKSAGEMVKWHDTAPKGESDSVKTRILSPILAAYYELTDVGDLRKTE